MNSAGKLDKPDQGEKKFFRSNKHDRSSLSIKQTTTTKNNEFKSLQTIVSQLQKNVMVTEAQRNKEKKSIKPLEVELEKKEQIINIYRQLLDICKRSTRESKRLDETKSFLHTESSSQKIDVKKFRLDEQKGIKSIKERKRLGKAVSMTISNTSSSILIHKSTQPTPNKASFIEKLDSRLNLRIIDQGNSREENDMHSPMFFKKNVVKKRQKSTHSSPSSFQQKNVISVYRMKKSGNWTQEKSSVYSGTAYRSLSPQIKN